VCLQRIAGLAKKGSIGEGMDADITIIDQNKEWEYTKNGIKSKSRNSPFYWKKFKGCVVMTICNGKVYLHRIVLSKMSPTSSDLLTFYAQIVEN